MNVHTHAIVEKVVVVDWRIILKWTKILGCDGVPWISVGDQGWVLVDMVLWGSAKGDGKMNKYENVHLVGLGIK